LSAAGPYRAAEPIAIASCIACETLLFSTNIEDDGACPTCVAEATIAKFRRQRRRARGVSIAFKIVVAIAIILVTVALVGFAVELLTVMHLD